MVKYWFSGESDMKLIQVISQCGKAMLPVQDRKTLKLSTQMRVDVNTIVR